MLPLLNNEAALVVNGVVVVVMVVIYLTLGESKALGLPWGMRRGMSISQPLVEISRKPSPRVTRMAIKSHPLTLRSGLVLGIVYKVNGPLLAGVVTA